MKFECLYHNYKPLAFSVAYQMMGSIHDAEDIVQDVYVDLKEMDLSSISEHKAYLMKMVVNKSLNFLHSARYKKEVYTGPWLPEPLVEINQDEPLHRLVHEESISYAFTVLLHNLTELERCVYILRESLSFDYATISVILNRTEQSLRKVYSRAKQKVKSPTKKTKDTLENSTLASLFINGATNGDFDPFINKLTENVILVTDGGGKVLAALNPIYGKKNVSAFLLGIYKRGSFEGIFNITKINGEQGILQEVEGVTSKAIMFANDSKGVTTIYFVMNPKKLLKTSHKFYP